MKFHRDIGHLPFKAVKENDLQKWIGGMNKIFIKIKDKYKSRHKKGKGEKLMGIRSLECNFNPKKQTYNSHFHLILPNRETADILLVEWQRYMKGKRTGKKYTNYKGQHKRPIKTDRVKDLIETIKYGSKIFTEYDVKNKSRSKSKIPPQIYAAALDNIFCALKGKRLFNSFGISRRRVASFEKKVTKANQLLPI